MPQKQNNINKTTKAVKEKKDKEKKKNGGGISCALVCTQTWLHLNRKHPCKLMRHGAENLQPISHFVFLVFTDHIPHSNFKIYHNFEVSR